MNLRDLQYIVAVAELKNFSQAALQCHVSQPTLSSQIKKMEELLGIALFERTNKKVMLTPSGEDIIRVARRILQEVDTIHAIAESSQDPLAGTFRIGAFPTLATYIFPQLMPKAKAACPNLKLILREDKTADLLEQLKAGDIDAALIALPVEVDGLTSEILFEDEFLLAVADNHPLAAASKVDLRVLQDHKLLLLDEGHCLRDQALDICHSTGASEEEDVRATGLETLRQMVKAGVGITLMPRIAIQANESGIRYIPFRDPVPKRTIGLVWRKSSARLPVMHALIAQLSASR